MCGLYADEMREGLHNGIDVWNDDKINSWERECQNKAYAEFSRRAPPMWGILIADALSLAGLWLLAWMIVAVGRWVAAGFRQQA
jgi:hypothetical protein